MLNNKVEAYGTASSQAARLFANSSIVRADDENRPSSPSHTVTHVTSENVGGFLEPSSKAQSTVDMPPNFPIGNVNALMAPNRATTLSTCRQEEGTNPPVCSVSNTDQLISSPAFVPSSVLRLRDLRERISNFSIAQSNFEAEKADEKINKLKVDSLGEGQISELGKASVIALDQNVFDMEVELLDAALEAAVCRGQSMLAIAEIKNKDDNGEDLIDGPDDLSMVQIEAAIESFWESGQRALIALDALSIYCLGSQTQHLSAEVIKELLVSSGRLTDLATSDTAVAMLGSPLETYGNQIISDAKLDNLAIGCSREQAAKSILRWHSTIMDEIEAFTGTVDTASGITLKPDSADEPNAADATDVADAANVADYTDSDEGSSII